MQWFEIISLILNLVFGGGLLVTLVTLKSQKKKAEAEVEMSEIDNVQEAVKIWREMAESLRAELEKSRTNYEDITTQVELLRKEIHILKCINNKIMILLDKITGDNFENIIEQIKKEINGSN